MALRRKRLPTARMDAVVRLLTSMETEMCLQVTLFVESFFALFEWADEVTNSIVLLQVDFKALLPTI